MLEKMHGVSFTASRWRAGCLADLGLVFKDYVIIANAGVVRRYAIGWCEGEALVCRPKEDHVAVMFEKDGVWFWNHLRKNEFQFIFEREGA